MILTRFHRTLASMTDLLVTAGLDVVASLERQPVPGEKDAQAFVVVALPVPA